MLTFGLHSISVMSLGQKLLNWRQYLRFSTLPRVSHKAVDLMQQLLCEPEHRLGSQASSSVVRPNSMIMQARRSAFATPLGASRVEMVLR
jgi:protein-serine/threonine kinase